MGLLFDGVDDDSNHGDIAGLDGSALDTVMMWINPTDLVATDAYIIKFTSGVGVTLYWCPNATTSSLDARNDAGANFGSMATTLIAGQWVHAAFVYDGGQVGNAARLLGYRNGVNQTLAFNGTIPASRFNSGTNVVRIGGASGIGFPNCRIAHVKIWTAALTAAAIAQEMNSYRPVRTSNLILWLPYDDGTRARDYSGTGNHGTVTGALPAGGPPQIPRPDRFYSGLQRRRKTLGLLGHRILP